MQLQLDSFSDKMGSGVYPLCRAIRTYILLLTGAAALSIIILVFFLSIFQASTEYLYEFSCRALSAYSVTMQAPLISLQEPLNIKQHNVFLR